MEATRSTEMQHGRQGCLSPLPTKWNLANDSARVTPCHPVMAQNMSSTSVLLPLQIGRQPHHREARKAWNENVP